MAHTSIRSICAMVGILARIEAIQGAPWTPSMPMMADPIAKADRGSRRPTRAPEAGGGEMLEALGVGRQLARELMVIRSSAIISSDEITLPKPLRSTLSSASFSSAQSAAHTSLPTTTEKPRS